MPILEDDDMPDRAVLWRCTGYNDESVPTYDTPEEIWLNFRLKRSQSIGEGGITLALDGQASVLERIPLESKIWIAPDHTTDAVAQWYASGSAGQTDEVMRVATQGEVRDQKNIEVRYTVGLQWYRDQ